MRDRKLLTDVHCSHAKEYRTGKITPNSPHIIAPPHGPSDSPLAQSSYSVLAMFRRQSGATVTLGLVARSVNMLGLIIEGMHFVVISILAGVECAVAIQINPDSMSGFRC